MYPFIMHDSRAPLNIFLEGIFKFAFLLIRGIIKGLSGIRD